MRHIAAQRVGLYFKYFNSPLRFAASWDDPKALHLGPLPKFANGEGSTVFWTTGCALFKHGKNKEKVAEYIKALTYDQQIWKDSIVGVKDVHMGQLPPYKSIYAGWDANKPDWMPDFVALVRSLTVRPGDRWGSGATGIEECRREGLRISEPIAEMLLVTFRGRHGLCRACRCVSGGRESLARRWLPF